MATITWTAQTPALARLSVEARQWFKDHLKEIQKTSTVALSPGEKWFLGLLEREEAK